MRHRGVDGLEDGAEAGFPLQVAQTGGVGGGDVDDDVVGMRGNGGDEGGVVALGVGAGLVDAHICANRSGATWVGAEVREIGGETVVVEAHAVDHRAVRGEAEQAGARVAGLGQRRDGAGLDEAEAEAGQGGEGDRIFVEPSGEADRVGEGQAEGFDCQTGIVTAGLAAGQAEAERLQSKAVRRLRVEQAEQRGGEADEVRDHGALPA